jgi:hypothetical protein
MSVKSERDTKAFQSYLDNIKAKTGKTPDNFRKLAAQKGLTQYKDVLAWLKTDEGLGHGHANLIAQMVTNADKVKKKVEPTSDPFADHFKGEKAHWRNAFDGLAEKLRIFGDDVTIDSNRSYINLFRGTKRFGLVQISATNRIDIGIKLKGVEAVGRLEAAGSWNATVTHRVRIVDAKHIDKDVLAWLKQAYVAAP